MSELSTVSQNLFRVDAKMSTIADRSARWKDAIECSSVETWENYIKTLQGYDLFPFVRDFGRLREFSRDSDELSLSGWINIC